MVDHLPSLRVEQVVPTVIAPVTEAQAREGAALGRGEGQGGRRASVWTCTGTSPGVFTAAQPPRPGHEDLRGHGVTSEGKTGADRPNGTCSQALSGSTCCFWKPTGVRTRLRPGAGFPPTSPSQLRPPTSGGRSSGPSGLSLWCVNLERQAFQGRQSRGTMHNTSADDGREQLQRLGGKSFGKSGDFQFFYFYQN